MAYTSCAVLGLSFPLVIMMLVPFRLFAMPRIFTAQELDWLDNEVNVVEENESLTRRRGFLSSSFGSSVEAPKSRSQSGDAYRDSSADESVAAALKVMEDLDEIKPRVTTLRF